MSDKDKDDSSHNVSNEIIWESYFKLTHPAIINPINPPINPDFMNTYG